LNYRKEIQELFPTVIDNLSTKNGRLTYLSLTSKPEGPIRDEFAWILSNKLRESNPNLVSAREYSRYDLAILEIFENPELKKAKRVEHIFEFKVGSAGNFRDRLKAADNFVDSVEKDFFKGLEADPEIGLTQRTGIFLAPEAIGMIENNNRPFIKYASKHNGLSKLKSKFDSENPKFIADKIRKKFEERDSLAVINQQQILAADTFRGLKARIHFLMITANEKIKTK
jgi:predicted house-cleaning noncanonical NTP pyrophosphatase (MazG superfamily)